MFVGRGRVFDDDSCLFASCIGKLESHMCLATDLFFFKKKRNNGRKQHVLSIEDGPTSKGWKTCFFGATPRSVLVMDT